MIVIVSNLARERAALGALCESRQWPCAECDSLRGFRRLLRHTRPRIVLTRHRLDDGYSDDVITSLAAAGQLATTRLIVLAAAGLASSIEARQVSLGADLVQRDPVRTEVLLEYLAKYRGAPTHARVVKSKPPQKSFEFAGASVHPLERTLQRARKTVRVTPREIELIELLFQSVGEVVTYETLFNEILGRRFRSETSNMRVLLGKLDASARQAGIRLRDWVEVIPKLGYRYRPAATPPLRISPARKKFRRAA